TAPEPAKTKSVPHRKLLPEWRKQAEAGHNARAVQLVEEQGVPGAIADASSDDLMLLADAARLTKRVDLGRTVLQALRERFPASGEAAEAAFRLGRLEFDAHRFAEAGAWFDAYVHEAPQGPFAVDALGRRLDAWQRSHDARARDAAAEYLKMQRNGPYAELAKKVMDGAK